MNPYITILRPANCLMSSIAVAVGGLLVLKTLASPLLPASIAAFLITGAGNVINDYIDIEADKVNKPKRPIPSGKIRPRAALFYSIILFIAGLAFSLLTTPIAILIALASSLLLVLYATTLKQRMFLGNAAVSLMVGLTILFGSAAVASNPTLSFFILPLLLMSLSSLSNFSRELVKVLEDIEGDRLAFIKQAIRKARAKILQKFHIKKGKAEFKYSQPFISNVAAAFLIIVVAISPLPYTLNLLSLSYLIALAPTNLVFLLSIYTLKFSKSKNRFSKTSKLIKVGMSLGLVAYLVGVMV